MSIYLLIKYKISIIKSIRNIKRLLRNIHFIYSKLRVSSKNIIEKVL